MWNTVFFVSREAQSAKHSSDVEFCCKFSRVCMFDVNGHMWTGLDSIPCSVQSFG